MLNTRALAVTALLGSLAFAAPAFAATGPATPASPAPASSTTASRHHAASADKKTMEERVEDRIATLHEKLKITPEEEDDWKQVAQAMRDNEESFKTLIDQRKANATSMTAVEDLESYQKIAQARVDGLGKVISAFQPLYDNMSDDQKKNADEVFGRFEGVRDASAPGKPAKKSAQ